LEVEKPDKEVRFSILRLWGSTTEEKQRGNNLRTGWPRALSAGKHLVFWLAAVIWGFSTLEVGGGFSSIFPQTLLASVSSRSHKLPGSRVSECSANAGSIPSNLREN